MSTLGDQDYTFTATNLPFLTAMATNGLIVSRITVLNTDTTNRKIYLSRVAAGGGSTLLVTGTGTGATGIIPPNVTVPLTLSGFVLKSAESLNGFASVTNKVNISVSYVVPS
jgi:hypothetical protein